MKKLLVLAGVFPLVLTAQNKTESFKINGSIKKPSRSIEWVHIQYRNDGNIVHDSVQVKKGKFSYSGELMEPTAITLYPAFATTDGKKEPLKYARDYATVFAGKGKIKVTATDSLSNVSVKGSKAHEEYKKLKAIEKSFDGERNKLIEEWIAYDKDGNTEKKNEISDKIDDIDARVRAEKGEYLKANPNSLIAVYALKDIAGWDIKPEEVEPLYDLLSPQAKAYPSAVTLKENIDIAKKTQIGKEAMNFTQNDTLGKPVSLSSFRGTYVLIDFWASWCGPCRAESPNLVKAYAKFHQLGLNILSVSLDRQNQKERWIKAIHDDQLNWTHVSDLKYWENEVAEMYGIKAIPQNLLIDPQGKIIAKNLRGENLEKELEGLIDYKKTY